MLPKGERLNFVQPSVKRQWMDETVLGYSYRCLPMTYASRHGWAVEAPEDIRVTWDGGIYPESTNIISGRFTEHGHVFADNGTGNGIVTFHINAIPRTGPDWNLWIMPAPNLVIPGASPLGAVIESDWMFTSPTMNWKLTVTDQEVVFKKGDPVFFFVPVHKTFLEGVEIEHDSLENNQELKKHFEDHIKWRSETEQNGDAVFGKMYMRGEYPDGSEPKCPYNHKTRLILNESDSNS